MGTASLKVKTIKIRGLPWTVKLLDHDVYQETHNKEDDSVGITLKHEREIHFDILELNQKVVIHELFHAYCSVLYINSADLDITQFEEVVAEFLEDYAHRLYSQSWRLYRALKS